MYSSSFEMCWGHLAPKDPFHTSNTVIIKLLIKLLFHVLLQSINYKVLVPIVGQCRVSQGKSLRFMLTKKLVPFYTYILSMQKNLEKKNTLNWNVKPLILDGLKTSRHVVSHKPSEFMF